MSIPQLSRVDVITRLRNEHGRPLVILPWWREALAALDDPKFLELLLLLMRQSGKSTFLGQGCATTELLCVPNSYTVLVAASQTQQQAIFHRKIRRPLERLLKELGLSDVARFTAHGVEIPELNSAIEVVCSTDDTTPGRTVTLLIVDEARYVPDAVFTALAPSVIGAGGKIVEASTAGPPRGFFYELTQNPTPETWFYRSEANENPEADRSVLDFIRRRLGLVSPSAAQRELGNVFAEDGEELLPIALIETAIDDDLGETPTTTLDAFAFVDLGRKHDLASRVVVVRDKARRPEAADHLIVASVCTWDPKASPTGEVDFAEVRADLGALPSRFPNLKVLRYDEGAEAGTIADFCRQHSRLSLIVDPFTASVATNMELWGALLARLNARTLSIPRHERLLSELRGLRREEFAFGSKWRVVDGSRRFHRDVSLSLAGAVLSAGDVFRCPICNDAECTGEVPFGLASSPTVRAWLARHPDPERVDDDDVDDDDDDVGVQAEPRRAPVDSALAAARRVGGAIGRLGLSAVQRAVAAVESAAPSQAIDAVLPVDERDAWQRAELRRQRRELRARERREQEEAVEVRRRMDANARALAAAVRRGGGAWFPQDRW